MEEHAYDVVRLADQFAYGTAVFPFNDKYLPAPSQAVRPTPLPQWFVSRENFEQEVKDGYAALLPGEPKQLVAPTGVGKTTKLPTLVARGESVVGMVALPDSMMAMLAQARVAQTSGIETAVLRSFHLTKPLCAPALYFVAAADLLGHMASKRDFLKRLGIAFIYLDESHMQTPDYKFFRRMVSSGLMSGIKLFYGSATVVGDVDLESSALRTVHTKPLAYFPNNPVDSLHKLSPLHPDKMSTFGKTLLLVPTDTAVDEWAAYYKDHDFIVLTSKYSDSSVKLPGVIKSCAKHKSFILVATSKLRMSYNLDLDTVVDTCRVQDLQFTPDCTSCTLIVRQATTSEVTQGAGRVARFKPGVVYRPELEPRTPVCAPDNKVLFYEYLWSVVFNMRVNDPDIMQFADLTGKLSPLAAALLLNSRVHAIMLLAYVGNTGYFRGFEDIMSRLSLSGTEAPSHDNICSTTENWQSYNTGPRHWIDKPDDFSSAFEFPREWYVIPYMLWRAHENREFVKMFRRKADTRSVITAVSEPRNKTSLPLRDSGSVKPKRTVGQYHEYDDIASLLNSRKTLVPGHFTGTLQSPTALSVKHMSTQSSVERSGEFDRVPYGADAERIVNWQRDVTTSSSSGSLSAVDTHDRNRISLYKVDPVKYKNYKLYPMDETLFRRYIENNDSNALVKAAERYEMLVNGRRIFSELTPDQQADCFISILKLHNARIVASLQVKAKHHGRIERFYLNIRGVTVETSEAFIDSSARLLLPMVFESYFVGIDARSKHTGNLSATNSPAYDQYQAQATISMAFGDDKVKALIMQLSHAVFPILIDDVLKGHYFRLGYYLYMPEHVYSVVKSEFEHLTLLKSDVMSDVTVLTALNDSTLHTIRAPVENEIVYLIAYDITKQNVMVHGMYTIKRLLELWILDCNFVSGYSGALVVAQIDAAVLGQYIGWFDNVDDVTWSTMSTFHDFI